MKTTINTTDEYNFIKFIKQNGYVKLKKGHVGYVKQVKGGRLHLIVERVNNQLLIDLHYDKFKGNENKKFKHSTRHISPKVKKELDMLIKKYGDIL